MSSAHLDQIAQHVEQFGAGEVQPVVAGPRRPVSPWLLESEMELVALGYLAGAAVLREVLDGGPRVLGTRREGQAVEGQSELKHD